MIDGITPSPRNANKRGAKIAGRKPIKTTTEAKPVNGLTNKTVKTIRTNR